jgi:acetyl-CoA carboxylase carboxyltransferase component
MATVVLGQLYGLPAVAYYRADGMFERYVWPSAHWGSMHVGSGTLPAYRREIESAADPSAKQREIESRLTAIASPFRTAEATGQDIIDPRTTRARLCEFVESAQDVIQTQLGPGRGFRP